MMQRVSPELSRLAPVFDAAEHGVTELPELVVEAVRTLERLQAAPLPDELSEAKAFEQDVDAQLTAAAASESLPQPAALMKARRAAETLRAVQQVRAVAIERAASALVAAVHSHAEAILASAAAELDPMLDAARKASAKAPGDGSREALLAGGTKAIDTERDLERLAQRYRRLRSVRRVLEGTGTYDVDGEFTESRNGLGTVWPGWNSSSGGEPPWPQAPAARLRWLAESGHAVWLPSAEERSARWTEVRGDVDQQRREQQRLLRGVPVVA
jgi:cell division septum initiation protein DivIVA